MNSRFTCPGLLKLLSKLGYKILFKYFVDFANFSPGLKKEYAEILTWEVPISQQVVVDKGNIDGSKPSPTQGKDPVDPLKTSTGTWNVCLSPFFLILSPISLGL